MRYRTSISYQDSPYNDDISHPKIIEAYQYLQLNHDDILKQCDYVIIRTNGTDIWLNFIGKLDNIITLPIKFNIYINNQYITGTEYVTEELELFGNHIIKQKQHPQTFFQSEHDIRLFIYNYICKQYSHLQKICLFGGEFYLYSQLFNNPEIINCFTDSEDLYNDALYNNDNDNDDNVSVNLIDYNNYELSSSIEEMDIIIIQVGPNGLKANLLKQILKIKTKHIIYIGCKKDVVDRDTKFLGYDVTFYKDFDNSVFIVDLVNENNNNDNSQKESKLLIGLGGDCSVAYQLNRHGYRSYAYPFDWLKSGLDDIISLIKNNFNKFLDADQLIYKRSTDNFKFVINSDEENVQVNCGFIYHHKQYKSIQFCHDFTDDKQSNLVKVQEKYRRRIDRFQKVLYSGLCILIRYESNTIKEDTLLKWESDIGVPLVIITGNPKNYKYFDKDNHYGQYITFFKDISEFKGWERDNYLWLKTFKKYRDQRLQEYRDTTPSRV